MTDPNPLQSLEDAAKAATPGPCPFCGGAAAHGLWGDQYLSSSRDHAPAPGGVRELILGGARPQSEAIDLRDLCFVGTVSDEARAEIERAARRALRVLTTAHLYWFGAR